MYMKERLYGRHKKIKKIKLVQSWGLTQKDQVNRMTRKPKIWSVKYSKEIHMERERDGERHQNTKVL